MVKFEKIIYQVFVYRYLALDHVDRPGLSSHKIESSHSGPAAGALQLTLLPASLNTTS